MSVVRRFANLFRQRRLNRDIAAELASHLEEAVEHGRTPDQALRDFGSPLLYRERVRDHKLLPWLDSLFSDAIFGARRFRKHPAASLAAILSLALAMGATTSVYRIVDALLLRTLSVANPRGLFVMATSYIDRDGRSDYRDSFDYPTLLRFRRALSGRADVLAIGVSMRPYEAVFGASTQTDRVYRQYLSGNAFRVFGLHPAIGRLITPDDDRPGAPPAAVLGYDFWTRRFARDARVIGATLRLADSHYTVIGVAPRGFTGTEPGRPTDLYLPAAADPLRLRAGWLDFQIWLRPHPGLSPEQVRQPAQAAFARDLQDRAQALDAGSPRQTVEALLRQQVLLLPAVSGTSDIQSEYQQPLLIVAALVVLVLLIACVNVGNLLASQAAARAREMALRVSIGAGRWRLVQLAFVEAALLALAASALGAVFAAWSAPFIVSVLHVPADPVQLNLSPGWRDLAFGAALTAAAALFFGIAPALRASAVDPISALRGGAHPHSHRRLMKSLLSAQVAFCVLVLFVAGLFVSTFRQLAARPLGFSPRNLLILDASAARGEPLRNWTLVADAIRQTPGVRSVALSGVPPLTGDNWRVTVRLPGRDPSAVRPYTVDVSPGYFDTMGIARISGRDFRPGDRSTGLTPSGDPIPGVGIVNQAFAGAFFGGRDPVGQFIEVREARDRFVPLEIIGYVRDAAYRDVREPFRPILYVPMSDRIDNTLLVRTAADPLPLAPLLRREVARAAVGFRVRTVETQEEFLRWQTVRERLLATLSFFFAAVALALAAVGLFGVLSYSVTRRRREIGIRMALGARPVRIVAAVSADIAATVALGILAGLAAGLFCARSLGALLFGIRATDPQAIFVPLLLLLLAGVAAAVPPSLRAARIDPARTLKSE